MASVTEIPVQEIPKSTAHSRGLAHTIGRNTVFGIVARGAQVGTRLITIPIVIAHLGLGGYGIWSIIMTTAAYMRFGSVGIKSAFQKYVAEATGNGDYERANKLVSTGMLGVMTLSVLTLIPIAIFSPLLARASGVPPEFLRATAKSISALALIMVMSNFGAAYEAIVSGGHRLDLVRNFSTLFTIAEAIAIITALHYGKGLFAMSLIMAVSELGLVVCCYFAAKRVMPQVQVRIKYATRSVAGELVRFAGSYQLVNILEVLYVSIVPVAILRSFGAQPAGVYAITTRLVQSAMMLWESFLLPILSGGAMVYASGSVEQMRRLVIKAFKITMGLCLFPLAFIAVFGPTMVLAWTGQADSSFRVGLWIVCLAGFFQGFSVLGLVLYRVSGKALLDNIRQGIRIVILLSIAVFARRLGFYGVLWGLAAAEFVGMLFMLFAVTKTFHSFHPRALLSDAAKLTLATAAVLLAGALAALVPLPGISNPRLLAGLQLGKVCLGCLLAAWPALVLTKSITESESKTLRGIFLPHRLRSQESAG